MASERSRLVGDRRVAVNQPPNTEAGTRPLFGTKLRSTREVIKELRGGSRGDRRAEEPEHRRLFGNRIRDLLRELVEFRERRQATRDIARGD